MTAEHTHVLIDSKYWDKHLSFVAMTRHKQSLTIYADTINHPNLNELKRTLSRSITKDNVIDWPLDYAIRAGFNPDKLIGRVVNHIAGMGHKIKDGLHYLVAYENNLLNDKTKDKASAKHVAHSFDNESQKRAFDAIKQEYPVIADYDELLKQRRSKTGYYLEKIDKNIQKVIVDVLKDDKLMRQLKHTVPTLVENLMIYQRKLDKGIDRHL